MHQIPITQMEILRDSSTLFAKDLPLNPYYKSLTSDIIFANNSLKASEPQTIEAFFQQFICEKNQENDNKTPPPESENGSDDHKDYYYDDEDDYDEENEYNKEKPESILPESDYSSHYASSKPSKPFLSSTSLQEKLDNQLKFKKLSSLHIKESDNKKTIKLEPEYYCFPHKYKNYKYAKANFEASKLNNETNKTIEKKRMMILKNQKRFEISMKEAKTLGNEESTYQSTDGVHRSLYDKAMKTQQNMFLLPEEKQRLIKKNLKELTFLEKSLCSPMKRWVSPFMKHPNILPEIPESKEFPQRNSSLRGVNHFSKTRSLKKDNFSNSLNSTIEKEHYNSLTKGSLYSNSTNYRKGLEVKGENRLPAIKYDQGKKTVIDYKALFSELETLKNLSQTKIKSLEGLIMRSPKKKTIDTTKKNTKEINSRIFMDFYRKLLRGKPSFLIEIMLKPFGIEVNNDKFGLDFTNFLSFHRTLISKQGLSHEEEIKYLLEVFFREKNREHKEIIKEIINEILTSIVKLEKMKRDLKKRIIEKLELESAQGDELIHRKDFEKKLTRETEIRDFFIQSLRAKKE